MRRPCFPNSGSHQHGPPLLGRVRAPLRSPTSPLLCSPPTPSLPSAAAPVIPRQRPTSVRRSCSSPPHRCPPPTGATPETFLPRLPASRLSTRGKNEGIPGAWAILFVRAVVYDPARCDHPSPVLGEVAVAFRRVNTLGTRKHVSFVATYPRPTRSRAYASPNPLPSPAQGSLPAGRAHPSPGGFRTRWMTNKVSWGHRILHSPLDQPCLVALPPKLIIFNGFLVGAGAQHCQGRRLQRDRFATTMTIPTRNGDFGTTRAGSEWPARRAHSTACPNA